MKSFTETEGLFLFERMMEDHWLFGLLLSNGKTALVTHLDKIFEADGVVWLDVSFATEEEASDRSIEVTSDTIVAPTERTHAPGQ